MNSSEPLSVVGPIALLIPLLVTVVVCAIARREGTALPAGALLRLSIATLGTVVLWRFVAHPAVILGGSAVLFCFLAIPVMRALERVVIERISEEPVRTALLVPRNVGSYLPMWGRSAVIVAALTLLGSVAARGLAGRPSLLTIGLTFAALTFFGLYETWIRQEVFSVCAKSDAERRTRVRAIFSAQTTLTLSFLFIAALSAGAWPGAVPLGAIAGIVGAIGCAFAMSTGIQERYLRAWRVLGGSSQHPPGGAAVEVHTTSAPSARSTKSSGRTGGPR